MNEELQKAVTRMLEGVIDSAGAASNFLEGEIPLYVQELLMWKAVYSGVTMLIALLMLFLLLWKGVSTHLKIYSWVSGGKDFDLREAAYFFVVPALVLYLMLMSSMINFVWLQIWLAPRVYLVEYAASLVK